MSDKVPSSGVAGHLILFTAAIYASGLHIIRTYSDVVIPVPGRSRWTRLIRYLLRCFTLYCHSLWYHHPWNHTDEIVSKIQLILVGNRKIIFSLRAYWWDNPRRVPAFSLVSSPKLTKDHDYLILDRVDSSRVGSIGSVRVKLIVGERRTDEYTSQRILFRQNLARYFRMLPPPRKPRTGATENDRGGMPAVSRDGPFGRWQLSPIWGVDKRDWSLIGILLIGPVLVVTTLFAPSELLFFGAIGLLAIGLAGYLLYDKRNHIRE